MGEAQVYHSDAPCVGSPEETAGRFYAELSTLLPQWKEELAEQPEQLGEVERRVHAEFSRGADLVVAGLLGLVMGQKEFQEQAEQTREAVERPLRDARSRKIQLRLFGGLVLWGTTLYCAPRRSRERRNDAMESTDIGDVENRSSEDLPELLARAGRGLDRSRSDRSRCAVLPGRK